MRQKYKQKMGDFTAATYIQIYLLQGRSPALKLLRNGDSPPRPSIFSDWWWKAEVEAVNHGFNS